MSFTPIKAIDVTQYGATGDGVTDDALAIQNAVNDAISIIAPGGGLAVTTSPRLYFPPGIYAIGKTIQFSGIQNSLSIIGDDAVIMPTAGFNNDPNNIYGFYADWCYDFEIRGIHFKDFNKALFLSNPNLNTAKILVEDCVFYRNTEALYVTGESSIVNISRCKFCSSSKAIHFAAANKATVRDCWFESGDMSGTHPAQIENYGRLGMYQCLLVPDGTITAIEPAWINNYGSVEVYNTRQGGETDSFTLINNFAGVGNVQADGSGPEPSCVAVRDCQCYALYGSIVPGDAPVILRFVDKIPNQVFIENNRGLIMAKAMDFSTVLYGGNATLIDAMIQASGASGVVTPFNVCVKISHNVGGWAHGNGSQVPDALLGFVRDIDDLWPNRPTIALPSLGHSVDGITGAQVYKFEYPALFEDPLLLSFSGNLNSGGWSGYRGQLVGIIKANGSWTGVTVYALDFGELFNVNTDGSDPPFTVDLVWESSGTRYLDSSDSNRNFLIKITGTDGNWDAINLAPLNAMMR